MLIFNIYSISLRQIFTRIWITYLNWLKPISKLDHPITSVSLSLSLSLPPLTSKLNFSDRSFRNVSPRLWNSLPTNIRSLSQHIPTPSYPAPLPFNTLSLSRSQFLSRLKTHLFSLSYPLNSPPSSPIYGFHPVSSAPFTTRARTREYTNTIGFAGAI